MSKLKVNFNNNVISAVICACDIKHSYIVNMNMLFELLTKTKCFWWLGDFNIQCY